MRIEPQEGLRVFYQHSRMRYAEHVRLEGHPNVQCTEEIMIVGARSGEFSVRWHMLGGKPSAQLEVYEDAWKLLGECGDFLAWLITQGGRNPQPSDVVAALLALGFADASDHEEAR